MLGKLFTLLGTAAAATQTTFNISREFPRFPIEYILSDDSNTRIDGFAMLRTEQSTSSYHFGIISLLDLPRHAARSYIRSRGLIISEGLPNIEFDRPVEVLDRTFEHYSPTIYLNAGPGTDFARSCQGGFLIAPTSATENMLMINPSNVTEHAFEGQVFYAPHVLLHRRAHLPTASTPWSVNIAIRLTSNGDTASSQVIPIEQFTPCALAFDSPSDKLAVPERVFSDLLRRIERQVIRVHRGDNYRVSLDAITHRGYRERLRNLPDIEFVLLGENGQQIHIGSMSPDEYIAPRHSLYGYHLTIKSHYPDAPNFCSIDSRILKNLLLHFDTQNNRIGFGEPLVDL